MLAQSRFSTYNAKVFNLGINLTYKYTITNMGINLWNKFINKKDLVKVDLKLQKCLKLVTLLIIFNKILESY